MIDFMPIIKILPIFIIALASPGPDFFLISSVTLARGRLAGIAASAGITAGNIVWMSLCMFGLAVLLSEMQWVLSVIRVVGGMYLVYLGLQLWRASLSALPDGHSQAPSPVKSRNPFVMGLMTNLTNPKAMAFFTSIFSLTLTPGTGSATQSAMVIVMTGTSLAWFSGVTLVLSIPAIRKGYIRCSRWIDRVAGTFLAFFGLRLLWSAKS